MTLCRPSLSRSAPHVEGAGIVAKDHFFLGLVEFVELGDVIERLWHAFDMRPVGTEDHAVGTHAFLDLINIVFPEGIDPDMFPEAVGRIVLEVVADSLLGVVEGAQQIAQEFGAVLDRGDTQIREAFEELGFEPRQRNVRYELFDDEYEQTAVAANRAWLEQRPQSEKTVYQLN